MKIEGIPEGWEFVRIGTVLKKEWYLDNGRNPVQCNFVAGSKNYVVVKQIEPPKPTYRPFANAEEFAPHRDRWISCIGIEGVYRIEMVKRNCVRLAGAVSVSWVVAFANYRFEDGTPFGIEVK